MKRKIYLALGLFLGLGMTEMASAQQKIGSDPGNLNPGAVLELASSNRGFLPPRLNLTATNVWGLNGTATNGMIVYNNATAGTGATAVTPGFYVWQGSWLRVATGSTEITNALDYNAATRVLTSTINGVAASTAALPLATGSATGLLSSADFATFNAKENPLTFSNGLTRTANAITLGGALTGATSLTLGANNFTFGGATTGKVIVSGPSGSSTSGLQLSNLLTAVTPLAASAGQRILTVDGSGNVILGTDFGTANAGTVTNVTGTAPINVASGTTTPVISINSLGITTGLLADGAVTLGKIAPSGTAGQVLTSNGTGAAPTWTTLPAATVTGAANGLSLVSGNVEMGGALTKATTVTLGTNALTFDASGTGQLIVGGPTGNTSGLRLSNLTGAGTAGVSGQKVLSVNASGDVVLVTDFGTANAGTVTIVTGTAPINVTTGTTTPVVSINALGITSGLLADGAVTLGKIAPSGTAGQVLTSNGTGSAPTWTTLPASTNIYNADGTLSGNRTVAMGANNLTFTGTGDAIFNNNSLQFPGDNRFGLAKIYNTTIGDAYGMAQVNLTQSGDSPALRVFTAGNLPASYISFGRYTNATTFSETVRFNNSGSVRINNLAGTGSRMVVADATGVLGTQALPVNTDSQTLSLSGSTLSISGGNSVTLPASTNIYNGDGTLSANRTVSLNNNNLIFASGTGGGSLTFDRGHTSSNFRISASDTLEFQSVARAYQLALLPNGNINIGSTSNVAGFKPEVTSRIALNGSISNSISRITSATTLNDSDYTVIANAFAAGFTITLPAPNTCSGRVYVIRKVDESSNALTFTFAGITGTNAIRVSDSSATAGVYMNSLNYTRTIRIQSDGTDWYMID